MNKFLSVVLPVLLFSTIAAAVAFGSVNIQVDGKLYGPAQDLNFPAGTTITKAGPVMGFDLASTGLVSTITSGTIAGATINTSTIGVTTPAAAGFTTVYASGNVGLGTSVPGSALAVGAGTANAMAIAGGNDAYVAGHLEVDGNIYGAVIGSLTGNASGTAATVTTAAQPAITSVGTLSALNISGNIGIGTSVPGKQLAVGTTGQFNVSSTGILVDATLYGASAGTGAARILCVSVDGVIYGTANTCF